MFSRRKDPCYILIPALLLSPYIAISMVNLTCESIINIVYRYGQKKVVLVEKRKEKEIIIIIIGIN